MHEPVLLSLLNSIIEGQDARAWLDGAARRLQQKMDQQSKLDIAFEVVPRTVLSPPLPAMSAWVFILRRGRASGAERHPNSTQRMAALRGDGVFQTWNGTRWLSKPLLSEASDIERRWISIPPNVWHQAAPPANDWVVVSFHTVKAEDLIEERGDPASGSVLLRDTYL
jgi:hypothetical protein